MKYKQYNTNQDTGNHTERTLDYSKLRQILRSLPRNNLDFIAGLIYDPKRETVIDTVKVDHQQYDFSSLTKTLLSLPDIDFEHAVFQLRAGLCAFSLLTPSRDALFIVIARRAGLLLIDLKEELKQV